jgi:hypothetical protein
VAANESCILVRSAWRFDAVHVQKTSRTPAKLERLNNGNRSVRLQEGVEEDFSVAASGLPRIPE